MVTTIGVLLVIINLLVTIGEIEICSMCLSLFEIEFVTAFAPLNYIRYIFASKCEKKKTVCERKIQCKIKIKKYNNCKNNS